MTVVLVEHRLDLAAKYANHVIVMDKGKLVLDGDPRSVLGSRKARLLGVGTPKATRLYQLLQAEGGLKTSSVPLTPEETAELLRERLKA
jgi:energy-coupling factor transporter ATP-binding protein EcfA2